MELSSRRFGVEIECGNPNYYYSDLHGELKRKGVPVSSVGHDGSGCEVRTRVLQGKTGFKELETLFKALNDLGCYVKTPPDGQHIHLEALDFVGDAGVDARKRFLESYVNNRDNILPMVLKHRWTDNQNCRPAWKTIVEQNQHATRLGTKGYDINLSNIDNASDKRTIEVRLHEGNLDFEKAKAWIILWQTFLDTVQRRSTPFPKYKHTGNLLNAVGVREETKKRLKEAVAAYNH